MSTKSNLTLIYLIANAVIIAAFLLLGGGQWIRGVMHGSRSIVMANWSWAQILISFVLGFLVCLIVSRRKL